MATVEHCLFCFDTLASHLAGRKPKTLAQVQESWATYIKTIEANVPEPEDKTPRLSKRHPALQRLATTSSTSSSASSASGVSSSSSSTVSLSQPGSGTDTPATSVSSLSVAEYPLFVTWNTISAHEGRTLRGCIGTFEPQELEEGLATYALTSALHDTRFEPITARELPSLEVAVTLLTDFEDAADAMDWEIGKHGLRISFYYHGRRYGATYLPDVASEQGWTKEETVVSLMRKAGWMGRRDRWRDVELKVVRYQGKKESLEYAEYKEWRDWVDKQETK
ncbi:hypothetical protein VTK73DRAFT_1067 [Phialemonium thermophilum]|uniref:AMMECR1 domain-containing protein n=1 Tax=Phialemonium thermophilum TaxID=223376 RepID=A0ABR3VTY0_9PEZI